jgi:hypothetical protein
VVEPVRSFRARRVANQWRADSARQSTGGGCSR